MALYQDGDADAADAFDILYERFSPRVHAYLRRRTPNDETAHDLFQAVFLKLHRSRDLYDRAQPAAPWIFTITRSLLLDWAKTRKLNLTSLEEAPESALVDDRASLDEKDQGDIESSVALDQLSSAQREALLLRYNEDREFHEIAEKLRTSESNARKLVSRAIQKLRGQS